MKKLYIIIAVIIGVFALLGGVAYASDSAIPGDFLYPVDRATESVDALLTFNQDSLAKLRLAHLDERISELEELDEEEFEEEDVDDLYEAVEGEIDDASEEFEKEDMPYDSFEQIILKFQELTQRRVAKFEELKSQVGEGAQETMDELILRTQEKEQRMTEKMNELIEQHQEREENKEETGNASGNTNGNKGNGGNDVEQDED